MRPSDEAGGLGRGVRLIGEADERGWCLRRERGETGG
jgi:hypothetical protein